MMRPTSSPGYPERCPFVDAIRSPGHHPHEFVITALAILATPWEDAGDHRGSVWTQGEYGWFRVSVDTATGEFEAR
jgi:hypothetical protein